MLNHKKFNNIRANYLDYLPLWAKVSFNQLALYGVHIGHTINNLSPYSSWMVLGSRQGLCLINMFKFMYMFRGGLFIIQALIRRRSPIGFINLDQSSQSIVKSAAMECGEYGINDNWINGLLTNFHRITKAARRTMKISPIMGSSRHRYLTQNFRHGSLTRYTGPRGVFISNVMLSYNACQEAMNLRIPTVGIVDTNSPQRYVNIAVPGNDESFSSVGFYNNLMSMFVLYNKFTMVNVGYINRLSTINVGSQGKIQNLIYNIKNYVYNPSIKCQVNLNEFALTSPISNIKYGTLNHYQDILKTRAVQLMYGASRSAEFLRKDLTTRMRTYYNHNQIWLYALRNIYHYNKKWARAVKIRRKNRNIKVRITTVRKSAKLFKHAWHFLRHGYISNSRLLRTQTYNFWKFIRYLSSLQVPKSVMQMYKRYFRRAYGFPKSCSYTHFRHIVYNLLSTWFFIQFSTRRTMFSNFFHRPIKPLTGSIRQRRIDLRKLESKQIRHLKKLHFKNTSPHKHFQSISLLQFKNKLDEHQNVNTNAFGATYPYVNITPGGALPQNPWYLRVLGLRHSIKNNVFTTNQYLLPLKKFNKIAPFTGPISRLPSELKHPLATNIYNTSIKYVYNQWANFTNNSNINNSNTVNYYYNHNLSLFKPMASTIVVNTFTNIRPYYIQPFSYD